MSFSAHADNRLETIFLIFHYVMFSATQADGWTFPAAHPICGMKRNRFILNNKRP